MDNTLYRTVSRKGTVDDIEFLYSSLDLIEYFETVLFIDHTQESLYGYVIKIGDRFDYIYFETELKYMSQVMNEKVANRFEPYDITEGIKKVSNFFNIASNIVVLEVKDDYLVILLNKSVLAINRVNDMFGDILEQYNLQILNNQDV